MRIAIIVNEQRQDSPLLDKKLMDETAAKYDLSYDLFLVKPEAIEASIQNLLPQTYNGYVIGGGDGTVRSAVQLLVGQDIPLTILQLGTFNYFAKELGLPTDIDSLFKMIKNNKIKLVDVGEVNNHVFLNHSSVGFYSRIMKMRNKHPQLLTKNKFLKILFTAFNFFNELPLYKITIKIEGTEIAFKICLLVVGNNYHSTDMINFGNPVTLTMGLLEVLVVTCQNRWELFRCMIMMLFTKSENNKYISKYACEQLTVQAESNSINVVIDGDLFKLDVPLHYTINHKQLPVFVP